MGTRVDGSAQLGVPVEPRSVPVGGDGVITYRTYGDPTGDPVLLFHGTPGSGKLGAVYHQLAAEEGVRLIAPDRPGYGRSTAWDAWGPTQVPEALKPVVDDLGVTSLDLLGFSGGAPFALELGAAWPDRIGAITLVSAATPPSMGETPPLPLRLVGHAAAQSPALAHAVYGVQQRIGTRWPQSLVRRLKSNDESVPNAVSRRIAASILDGIGQQTTGVVTESRLFVEDWEVRCTAVPQPVELFHGDEDHNAPLSGARALTEVLPAASLEVLAGADHLGTLSKTRREVFERPRRT